MMGTLKSAMLTSEVAWLGDGMCGKWVTPCKLAGDMCCPPGDDASLDEEEYVSVREHPCMANGPENSNMAGCTVEDVRCVGNADMLGADWS